MKRIFCLLILFTISLTACQTRSAEVTGETVTLDGGSYTRINPDDLNAMLKDKDFVFINVHIPFAGNIADTDLSMPYDQITEASYLAQLPADKTAKLVLYCRSGRMSTIAAEALVEQGYTNLWELAGGMAAWEQAGYNTEK